MKKGIILFAHNNNITNYYEMAVYTAKRINQFLNLPVTIITDSNSTTNTFNYQFDNTIIIEPNTNNSRNKSTWINKGRYSAFDLTPYDETIVLDTDYMINSPNLLKLFNYTSDFVCAKHTRTILTDSKPEYLNKLSMPTLWATLIRFKKTKRSEQIFNMIQMIQENYNHYSNIYKFQPYMYRNDYALTIALHTVNGHIEYKEDYLHSPLLHVDTKTKIYRLDNTKYLAIRPNTPRNEYTILNDIDFHMLSKSNFMELTNDN